VSISWVPAASFGYDINTGSDAVPTWVRIKGIKNHDVTGSTKSADVGDFDTVSGFEGEVPIRRGRQVKLQANHLENVAGGARDPGQAAVEAAEKQVWPSARRQIRITTPGGIQTIGAGWFEPGSRGGGKDDVQAWETTFNVVEDFT
jgi:hypothetical protein